MVRSLAEYNLQVDVCDPWADPEEVQSLYGFPLLQDCKQLSDRYDVIVLTVAHQEFLSLDLEKIKNTSAVVFDVKSFLPLSQIDARL